MGPDSPGSSRSPLGRRGSADGKNARTMPPARTPYRFQGVRGRAGRYRSVRAPLIDKSVKFFDIPERPLAAPARPDRGFRSNRFEFRGPIAASSSPLPRDADARVSNALPRRLESRQRESGARCSGTTVPRASVVLWMAGRRAGGAVSAFSSPGRHGIMASAATPRCGRRDEARGMRCQGESARPPHRQTPQSRVGRDALEAGRRQGRRPES